MTTLRIQTLYFDALDFVDGMDMKASELIEIMREAKEYTEEEICYIVHLLLKDGYLKASV